MSNKFRVDFLEFFYEDRDGNLTLVAQ